MCGCECFISAKSMHSYLLTCNDCHLKKPKERSHNARNRRSDELSSNQFETNKNYVKYHGCYI